MTDLLHQIMAILLSGAVLTSSVLPPAVCHAHSEGGEQHSHRRDDEEPASNDHDYHHHVTAHSDHDEHEHGQPAEESSLNPAGIELAVAHLHFSVAGINFSLPLPTGDRPNGPLAPTRDDAGSLQFVRLTDDTVTVSRVDLSAAVDLSAPAPLLADSSVDPAVQAAYWRCFRNADRVFLCDSARCERSGVLLI